MQLGEFFRDHYVLAFLIWILGLIMAFPLGWISVKYDIRSYKKKYNKRTGRDYDTDMARLAGKNVV